jgi:hypothetical protein
MNHDWDGFFRGFSQTVWTIVAILACLAHPLIGLSLLLMLAVWSDPALRCILVLCTLGAAIGYFGGSLGVLIVALLVVPALLVAELLRWLVAASLAYHRRHRRHHPVSP